MLVRGRYDETDKLRAVSDRVGRSKLAFSILHFAVSGYQFRLQGHHIPRTALEADREVNLTPFEGLLRLSEADA